MSAMSFMEKLLDGVEVEWKALGEVAKYEQPTKYLVESTNYSDRFSIPVLTAGKTFILGYTDETDGIYKASVNPVIIFDDFTTANKWVDFDFKAKSSAMKMISSADESKTLSKYVYYWLNTLPSELVDGDHKRQWISNFANKKIPMPPLNIQAEIVRILDTFTALTAELTAELTARKQQYSYYRDQLLSYTPSNSPLAGGELSNLPPAKGGMRGVVEWKTLGEVGEILRGTAITEKETNPGEVPVVANGPNHNYYHDKSNRSGETVVIARSGAYAGLVSYWNKPIFLTDAFSIHPENKVLSTKFLYYVLKNDQIKIHLMGKGAGVPHVRAKDFESYKIPVPPLEEQTRIVAILDKFETLTNSISEGLPREIKLRQQQYEYYRDLLLSFPK